MKLKELKNALAESYRDQKGLSVLDGKHLPDLANINRIHDILFEILFPGVYGQAVTSKKLAAVTARRLRETSELLCTEIGKTYLRPEGKPLPTMSRCRENAGVIVEKFMSRLPKIRSLLMTDVEAAAQNDPAARSFEEILLSYPCVEAIATHRLAHELYAEGVNLIPRIMSERAHRVTGIDIHPGAEIGPYFFIDHGTGVVIGETAVIGARVTLYQGVTLGAKHPKNQNGTKRPGKRHPTLLENVTVYAGSTILGGDTVIGKNSVIGGNVWITESVPDDSKILAAHAENRVVEKSA